MARAKKLNRDGFLEAPQPLIQSHPLVSGIGLPVFEPHRPQKPEKSEGGIALKLVSEFDPQGDQPKAIKEWISVF